MFSHRKDLGVRVGGEKGQYADEFLTRSQLVEGTNIYIEYLPNFDLKIHALNGNGGGGGSSSTDDTGPRDLYVELKLVRPFTSDWHLAINDAGGLSSYRKFFGTHVFAEIRHNWGLNKADAFQYSVVDSRFIGVVPIPHQTVASLPQVVGVDANKIRIIGTDAKHDIRQNPYYWVDTEMVDGVMKMKNTRLANYQVPPLASLTQQEAAYTNLTPTYRIRITEVRDYEHERKSPYLSPENGFIHDVSY